jgi:hypothetical protein
MAGAWTAGDSATCPNRRRIRAERGCPCCAASAHNRSRTSGGRRTVTRADIVTSGRGRPGRGDSPPALGFEGTGTMAVRSAVIVAGLTRSRFAYRTRQPYDSPSRRSHRVTRRRRT